LSEFEGTIGLHMDFVPEPGGFRGGGGVQHVSRGEGMRSASLDGLQGAPIETVRRIHVPPDPGILKALGMNQSFESAVADLIDNSLDAEASCVLVRFILRRGRAAQLQVIDNGNGMNEARIDAAMKLGKPKEQGKISYGYYGMGLKSASFGQASTLTVMSRRARASAEGRRMYREKPGADFDVDVLNSEAVDEHLTALLPVVRSVNKGTLVQWDNVKDFPRSRDTTQTGAYIDRRITDLHRHLGMVYHRLLERADVEITIDSYDIDEAVGGIPTLVDPVNPFDYHRSGDPEYPKDLTAQLPNQQVILRCCIWPAKSQAPQYRLYGRPVESFQGFYLYRKDRLLKAGGWGGVIQESKSYKLARVAVDIDEHLDVFKMSVEKSGVDFSSNLVHAIEKARDDGGATLQQYLDAAADTVKKGNTWQPKRTKILPPGQGLDPDVKKAIKRGSPVLEDKQPISVKWGKVAGGDFVEVDRKRRTLWLNDKYRQSVLHGDNGKLNDAPLVKALMFLLYEDMLRGQAMGPKDKENCQFWAEVLTAAAAAEEKYQ
jgi:hypothetical protein